MSKTTNLIKNEHYYTFCMDLYIIVMYICIKSKNRKKLTINFDFERFRISAYI